MKKTGYLYHTSAQPLQQPRESAWSSARIVRFANSFRVWLLTGYAALLLLAAGDTIVSYRQLATTQDAVARLSRSDPTNQALFGIDQALRRDNEQLLYRGVALLVLSGLIASGATYSIAKGLLRPLRAISQALTGGNGSGAEPLDVRGMPTEMRPLAQRCNAMLADLDQRQHALHDQLQRTALLTRLSIELRESLDPASIVRDVLAAIVSNMDAASASMIVVDSASSEGLAYTMRNGHLRALPIDETCLLLDQGLAGWVLRHNSNVVLPDVGRDDRWLKLHGAHQQGSAIALPLTHTGTALGVLTITHQECEHFTSKDMLLLEGAAALTSVALRSAQRHTGEQRRREQALLLFAMSQSLTVEQSLDDLAYEVLQSSRSAFDASATVLFLGDNQSQRLTLLASSDDPAQPDLSEALRDQLASVANQAWRRQQAVSGTLTDHQTQAAGTTGSLWNARIPAYVALPLLHNGAAIGVFVLVCQTSGTVLFSAAMWSVLTTFTNVAAAAFANRQLVERLRQRAEVLEHEVSERTEQLQQSRDLLRIVFDNLPDGLVLLDSKARILTVNHAFCRDVIGTQPQQVIAQPYPALMQQLQRGRHMQIDPPLHTGPTQRIHCTDRRGQQRWYDIDRYPVGPAGAEQRIERWRDVTRQEELQRQLLLHEQRASIGRLALSVVHEVGNPLQSVRGCLDLCREGSSLTPEVADYLAVADAELERMAHILQRLRDLYRPSSLTWELVQLNELVGVVQRITQRQLQQQNVQLHTELAASLPPIRAQNEALSQVLLNVVLNAQQALSGGGTIRIATAYQAAEQLCRVEVRDTGKGMTPEHLLHIFEPFTSNKAQGLGLGLYLSKQIIDQHQGRISVESVLGAGTTVTVYLPQAEG